MARNTFSPITEAQIKKASIATLADRPNSISRYGDGGLSAQELKERFDAFPALVQKKINEIIEALASSNAAKYITLADNLTGKDNLYDFIMLFSGASESKKNIADYIYALYTYRNKTSSESKNLQEIFYDIASRVSDCESNNESLVGFVADHEDRITSNEEAVEAITTTIENHEERISGIEQYLGGDNFIVDDSTAYEKTVPKNACEKAKVLSIGGMSYRDEETNTFKHAKVRELKSENANLIPYPYDEMLTTAVGMTITHNSDGSITFNGTSNGELYYALGSVAVNQGETFTLSGAPSGGSNTTYRILAGAYTASGVGAYNDDLRDMGEGVTNTVKDAKTKYYKVFVNIKKGVVCNNLTFKPMLNRGTEALPFAKRSIIDTFTIPEAVQARKGYGLGVPNAVSNLIEFRGGRVFELNQCEEIVVDGVNVKFDVASTANGYRYFAITLPKVAYNYNSLVASHFEVSYKLEPGYAYLSGSPRIRLACYFIDQTMTTTEEANAYAAERYNSGNPIKFVVAYETAEESDITDLMPKENLIKVLGSGRIVAENEHSDPVPFSIKYLVTYPKGG
jgi:hypothetical protein